MKKAKALVQRRMDWTAPEGDKGNTKSESDSMLTYRTEAQEVRYSFSAAAGLIGADRKSTRLNSSHVSKSYAVFCLKKKNGQSTRGNMPRRATTTTPKPPTTPITRSATPSPPCSTSATQSQVTEHANSIHSQP